MAKVMYQFTYNKLPFELNHYSEYLSEVLTYITRNLSKNNLIYLILKIQEPNALSNMWLMLKHGLKYRIVFQTLLENCPLQSSKSLIKGFFYLNISIKLFHLCFFKLPSNKKTKTHSGGCLLVDVRT